MRLKKSQFKKIIMLMSILLGISVILCTANIILLPYISEMTTKYNEELKEVDDYGGFDLLEKNFTQLTEDIAKLKSENERTEKELSDTNTKTAETEALYNEALITNQMLKASDTDEYASLQEKYETLRTKYEELSDKYNKLKEEADQ